MIKHYKITITGKVQGVWFRANTQKKAVQLKINGFVKNQTNGSVLIEAEGAEASLIDFISWCKTGPKKALVENIDVQVATVQHYTNFKIKRF